jgi:M6 family metalloprotease-like protein
MTFENDVVGPFRLSRPRSYYVDNLLVEEALELAIASGVNLANYDSRGEGIVDSLSILYAGQTQYLGDLWPHNSYINLRHGNVRTNLYVVAAAGRTPADLSIGTFCHEAGHMLFRFPDLYDYGNRDGDGVESAGIGMYCLMGGGSHLGRGRVPSPVCGYLRDLAGWADSVTINGGGQFQATHGDYGQVLRYETNRLSEYFIVENRAKLGLDRDLPASGLAVFHCDTRGSNEWQEGSSLRHYQCALLQADGSRDLERNANQGDGADLFGPVEGVALSHATNPSSRTWDGADSGLTISAVGPPGPAIDFFVGDVLPTSGVLKGEATPGLAIPDRDPAGVASTIPITGSGVVRSMTLKLSITHTWVGDLRVELLSPSGRRAILHGQTGGSRDDIELALDSEPPSPIAAFVGEPVAGAWILRVADLLSRDVGKLNSWSIEITPG